MDFLRSLFEDLRSPDPALRFSVLERIDGIDWSPERLEALEQHLAEERRSNSSGS